MEKDIVYTDDVVIKAGDFDVRQADDQHIEHIMIAVPGQWYQNPTIGSALRQRINGAESTQSIKQAISKNLRADDFIIGLIDVFKEGDEVLLDINARRGQNGS